MYLLKVSVEPTAKSFPPVLLDDQGTAGMYNRANRSLHHYLEHVPGFLVCYPAAAFCFPFPAMCLAIFFCAGRIVYQISYTNGGFSSSSRGLGFVASFLCIAVLEGLVLVAALKALATPGI